MKELSRITETFTESVIREMTRISDSMNGINLSQGFPDFNTSDEIKQAAIRAIKNNLNQYPVTFGEPELREAICKKAWSYNNIRCNPETDITVTCGATEAMLATLQAIINPGDEIIIFEPFYENYIPDGILTGATPRYVTLHTPDWTFDKKELAAAFNENTKAIIINTPNNPTGKVFSKEELNIIAELCIKWNTFAITDEIYEHILYDSEKHVSLGSLPGMEARTITINSISKTYSVTGWRVGWTIASELITKRIRKVHDFMTVGAPTPFQHAAAEALNFPASYYEKLQKQYFEAREFMFSTLTTSGFKPYLPKGAYYIIADVTNLASKLKSSDDFDFSKKLIEKTRVATVPGFSFYSKKIKNTNQVRFAFCKKAETLQLVREQLSKNLWN
ncbi:MAG: aminotransferase class I/II-fold pyridoxal phosphate-dependent enzyme [Bacteroidetes bacterium]|nr:MAG: aminotransferase class I/II-fold pyridoxal phosphate-dependent enzyme [Bacteroidota bacterium]